MEPHEVETRRHYLKRKDAGTYLVERYGFGSGASLAVMASRNEGPAYLKLGSRTVIYAVDELDRWAQARISAATSSRNRRNLAA